MFTRTFIVLLILHLFAGCTGRQIDDIQLDYIGDQLTLVGYISPTEIKIKAGKTQPSDVSFFLSALRPPPDTKLQLLDEKDSVICQLDLSDNSFFLKNDLQLEIGAYYRVRATALGFATVESSLLLIPEPLSDLEIQPIQDIDDLGIPGATAGKLAFSFTDRSPERAYYHINFGLKKDTATYTPGVWIINEQWQEQCYSINIFSDDCFNERNVELQYGFQKVISALSQTPKADTFLMQFGPATSDLYHYYKNNIINNDGLIDGINEPPLTYTNLTNGYGVVFAQNWKEYKIAL
jgi:hypothetical protein